MVSMEGVAKARAYWKIDHGIQMEDLFKVAATSLNLEIRLQAHQVGTCRNARSGTEVNFTLM